MQSILSTHVRPEVFGHLFRLNLTVVRSVSGLPGLVRASPALFHKLGSFAGVRSATRVRLFGIGSVFCIRFGIFETVRLHLFAFFSDGLRLRRRRCRRRRRLHYNLPLSCAKFKLIYHTSLDSLCAGQVKLSLVRFTQKMIILRHHLVN